MGFGALARQWTFALEAADGETSVLDLRIDDSAWLHDLAATYVTELVVRLRATSGEGQGTVLFSPRAFLAWPSGRAAGPVVWDQAMQERLAPLGVLDDALRAEASATDASITRLLPPLFRMPTPRDEEE